MVDDGVRNIDRGRHAARAWLKCLHSTTKEKWEQEWELEQLLRLPAPATAEGV